MVHNSFYRRLGTYATSVCLLLSVETAFAADIAHEVRQGSDASVAFELGIGLDVARIPIVGWSSENENNPTGTATGIAILIDGRAEWRGLFAELLVDSFTGVALGYELWESEHSTFDLVLTEGLGIYDPGIGAFESVEERDGDVVAGMRSTHHFDNTIVQLELYSDISNRHDGQIAALQVGRFWQIRNWNLHGLIGARYFSDDILDYYFGISEAESTASIPRYQASGGTLATLEFGATVPISEKWIFKSTVLGLYLPDAVADSPLADDRIGAMFRTTFNYVF